MEVYQQFEVHRIEIIAVLKNQAMEYKFKLRDGLSVSDN